MNHVDVPRCLTGRYDLDSTIRYVVERIFDKNPGADLTYDDIAENENLGHNIIMIEQKYNKSRLSTLDIVRKVQA